MGFSDVRYRRITRTFGVVLISFAATSLPLLTDVHSDIEPLQFSLVDAAAIKSVVPNKQVRGSKVFSQSGA